MEQITIGSVTAGAEAPLLLIAGPCQIEGRDHALRHAEKLAEAAGVVGFGFVYKSSFDKANRTSLGAQRGVGLDEGLEILSAVRDAVGCPVLTDIHLPDQCAAVAQAVDILQNPGLFMSANRFAHRGGKYQCCGQYQKGQFFGAMGYASCC